MTKSTILIVDDMVANIKVLGDLFKDERGFTKIPSVFLIENADKCLYLAKDGGRNRVKSPHTE